MRCNNCGCVMGEHLDGYHVCTSCDIGYFQGAFFTYGNPIAFDQRVFEYFERLRQEKGEE